MIIISVLEKSFFRLVPILISITVGYLLAIPMGMVDFAPIINAPWIGFTTEAWQDLVTIPSFSLDGILAIAPIALVVFIEHIGDITTNGAVVGKDFFANPGIARTLVGDGLATVVGGVIGAPPNTTYGENTGVLAITKVYDPAVLRVAALYAIGLSILGKMGMLLQTIPVPVMGGVSVILFGMIAAVGVRTLIDADLNFTHSRNLVIAAVIFVFGIAVDNIVVWRTVSLSGLTIAAIIGIILNKILPKDI
jgi:uracil permease